MYESNFQLLGRITVNAVENRFFLETAKIGKESLLQGLKIS